MALDAPEGRIVDGGDLGLQAAEAERGALDQDEGRDRQQDSDAGGDRHRDDVVAAEDRRRPARTRRWPGTRSASARRRAASMVTSCARSSRRAGARAPSAPIAASMSMSRAAARGISKAGEPSRPTFSRTGPSIGAITLVANMQLSPMREPGGTKTSVPRKLFAPMRQGRAGRRGSTSVTLPSIRPSEATVPAPTEHRNGLSCPARLPKFEPVSRRRRAASRPSADSAR